MTIRLLLSWIRSRIHFVYGGLTLLPGFPSDLLWRHTGGTVSARYCYSVWMRHLIKSAACGGGIPKVVAELGPGDSIGIGLAALLSGADRYLAFDVVRYADLSSSIAILEELVTLFRTRARIPGEDEFPDVKPPLEDYSFPTHLITDHMLSASLGESRLAMLRAALRRGGDPSFLTYMVPWSDTDVVEEGSVDFIFSQAVMEHVDNIDSAYGAMNRWLVRDGTMSHQIDFKSHGLTLRWDGIRALRPWQWRVLRGKRPYLINRVPCSGHVAAMGRHGFEVAQLIRFEREPEVERESLAEEFHHLDEIERHTSGAYLLVRKVN
jgi:hypothetical protein